MSQFLKCVSVTSRQTQHQIQKTQEKRDKQHQLAEQLLTTKAASQLTHKKLVMLYEELRTQHKLIVSQQQRDSIDAQVKDSLSVIVAVENRRHPELMLHLAHNKEALKAQLADYAKKIKKNFHWFTSVHERFIFKNTFGSEHYIFADIHAKHGEISVIVLDSLNKCDLIEETSAQLTALHKACNPYYTFAELVKEFSVFDHAKVSIIPTGVQCSPADCVVFMISFALKAYKEKELFMKWHRALKNGRPLTSAIGNVVVQPNMLTARHLSYINVHKQKIDGRETVEDRTSRPLSEKIRDVDTCYAANQLLPPAFFKHASSSKVIQEKLDVLQQALRKNKNQLFLDVVSLRKKIRSDIAMLEARKQQKEIREVKGQKKTVLVSIEYKYRALLLRSIVRLEPESDCISLI